MVEKNQIKSLIFQFTAISDKVTFWIAEKMILYWSIYDYYN